MEPIRLADSHLKDGDALLMFNFRPIERARSCSAWFARASMGLSGPNGLNSMW